MTEALNLIRHRWIPVRRRSGAISTIRPGELLDAEDPPVTLLWPRPDLNLGCLAFLTGLTHAGMPPEDIDEWEGKRDGVDANRFDCALEPLTPWFDLDGDGARFMQEFGALEGDVGSIEGLLIDSSGGKTVKDNADLTVRRGRYSRVSRAAAAMMLYTFQSFAPAGGRGNRTSMCGGGPLYTFVEPSISPTLWELVWANVPYGRPLQDEADVHAALPWTRGTRTSEDGVETPEPELGNDSFRHWGVWWGMPRRIRLSFSEAGGRCDLIGDDDERTVEGMVQRPYGINYGLWQHPASPYYRQKEGGLLLPVHPKPGRFGYRHYRGIVLQEPDSDLRRRAATVRTFVDDERGDDRGLVRLIVGGWAMDNMKPLDFVLSRVPVPVSALGERHGDTAARAVAAADAVGRELTGAMKDVFGVDEKGTGPVTAAREAFFDATEEDFHQFLQSLSADTERENVARAWLAAMRRVSLERFDADVRPLIPSLAPEKVESVLKARRRLSSATSGHSKRGKEVFERLGLRPPVAKAKKKAAARITSTSEENIR